MYGILTTNPSLEWIAYEDADPKYFPDNFNSPKVPRVRFYFRHDSFPIPMVVEIDGDMAIEISENLRSGDRCILIGIVQSGGDPIRPYGINYEQKSIGDKDEDHYEHILKLIDNMAMVMVRDPSTFSEKGEEVLRSHLLVQLNAQYSGHATAETFNKHGKTDILIRIDGINVFIAECKFWKGPKSLTTAIDQLLGYTSSPDTKVAIIIFNRNKNSSNTISNR